MKNKQLLGHGMALFTAIVWGTTFISTKVLLEDLQPVEILFYRFLIAYGVLWIIFPKWIRSSGWKEEAVFLGLGLSGVSFYFLMENIALQYTSTSNVGLLVSVAPIITAILAHCFTKDEKFKASIGIGFFVAIWGIALVIFNGHFMLKLNPLGDLLAVGAAVVWGFYSILLKKVGDKYSYIYTTRKIFFYGLLTTLPCVWLMQGNLAPAKLWTPGVLPNILFLGLIASALCFVLWNMAVNMIGVVKTSSYIYLIPLVTIITAVVILGERITPLAAGGAVLILLGTYISDHGIPYFGRKDKEISKL